MVVHVLARDPLVRETAWTLLVAGSCAAVLAGIRIHRPVARLPWQLLALGLGLLAVVNVLEFPGLDAGPTVLAVASVIELVAFPCFGLAALALVRRQTPQGDRDGAVDGTIVMVAMATVLSATVFTSRAIEGTSIMSLTLRTVAPLLLAGVTAAALRLLFVRATSKVASTWFIVGSAAAALAGHVLRTTMQTAGTYQRGDGQDLLIAAAYTLAALAGLHPSMRVLEEPAPQGELSLTRGRLAVLGCAMVAPATTMLVAGTRLVPLLASILVSLLVLWRLWRLVIEREIAREDLRRQATHDVLTGLPNRRSLLEGLTQAQARAVRLESPLAVLFIDLDGFKRVNDDHGHAAGDRLLVAVADRLRSIRRQEDLLARLAGDEFVMICERATAQGAAELAERIISALRAPFPLPVGTAQLAVSVGIAVAAAGQVDAESLLAQADAAMYRAKERPGSNYAVYGSGLGDRLQRRRRLEADLATALDTANGSLRLSFQPIVTLQPAHRSQTVAHEVHPRWDHPELGVIRHEELSGLADTTGLAPTLAALVLREAGAQVAAHAVGGAGCLPLHVRLTVRALAAPETVELITESLVATGRHPSDLVIEVAGADLGEMADAVTTTLTQLRALGARVAVGCCRVGPAGLVSLGLPFDLLTLDAPFVSELAEHGQQRLVVEAVLGLAARLGVPVLGRGVDELSQLRVLHELGCDLGQGDLLGRPTASRPAPGDGIVTASPPNATERSAAGAKRPVTSTQ
jgi:diguanylate cyclase